MDPALVRYQRQIIFSGLGQEGQRRLQAATAVLVGCGATGTALANLLARAGIGRLRIADRDFVELSNLQRQTLFDEDDIRANLPKAEAAARRLRTINSEIVIEAVVTDVNPGNVLSLLQDATVVLDGTDNFSTRYLLNDACIQLAKPWIYTGVIAASGVTATFLPDGAAASIPGERATTGCLRCFLGPMPGPGSVDTCDTAGVVGPAVGLLSGIAAAEALKLVSGRGRLNPGLLHMDVWHHDYQELHFPRRPDCIACGQHCFDYVNAQSGATSVSLCGRDAVQVGISGSGPLDLALLERKLAPVASTLQRNAYLVKAQIGDFGFTVFPDNRAIIQGTSDVEMAKSLYARYIGG